MLQPYQQTSHTQPFNPHKTFKTYAYQFEIASTIPGKHFTGQQQPTTTHTLLIYISVLFSTIFVLKVAICVKELTGHEVLNSTYSIKQISCLFCLYWPDK